ncbi:hypothetical protein [Streptomyces sp. CBMA123]|uniref:hypothetical protein n=1 Tax=Streptomyces sp. CBMA123 TaxID=1896313 RepID=UPI0016621C3E|nr:hypothetical protein [Streptomyces sp. CBMA123]MBD0690641.1 hypothetical protein [Streptomyces sp. CBMA123]
MADTENDQPSERAGGLQAIWANTLEPVAPLPWYRKVSGKAVAVAAVVVGLLTALTVAAVTGAGAPPAHRIALADRIGDQERMPDDQVVTAERGRLQKNLTALSRYRDVSVAGYGAAGSGRSTLLVAGMTGSFPDARGELDRQFGAVWGSDVSSDPDGSSESIRGRRDYPAGPLGGALDCAVLGGPTDARTICVWADGTTVGGVIDGTGETRPEDLAKRALEIRTAVEVEAED